jgi:tetratricopeptide (TPR) repeat protein
MTRIKTAAACLGVALLAAALAATPGCSLLNRRPAETLPAEAAPAEGSKAQPAAAPEADQALASGDYEKAFEIYRTHYELDRENARLRSAVAAALETVKREADSARIQGRHGVAIRYYRLLVDSLAQLSPFSPALTFSAAEVKNRLKECRVAVQAGEAERALAAGQHEKAFGILAGALKESPGDSGLLTVVERAFKETRSAADRDLSAGEYAAAGKKYALLRDAPTGLKGMMPPAGLDDEGLERALKSCSAGLTNLGLVEYRKGNLAGAVAIWESLLSFEPDNAEVKKAVQTARAQLEKIKG